MTFPDRDAYMLKLDACTFFIERESPSSWLLSYRTSSGHYDYRRCSAPGDCAALLRNPANDDQDWLNLNEGVPSLRLPETVSDLSSWVGVSDAPPQ
jgi:hypothetical protein